MPISVRLLLRDARVVAPGSSFQKGIAAGIARAFFCDEEAATIGKQVIMVGIACIEQMGCIVLYSDFTQPNPHAVVFIKIAEQPGIIGFALCRKRYMLEFDEHLVVDALHAAPDSWS